MAKLTRNFSCRDILPEENFLNGPGKVCRAMDITRPRNSLDLAEEILFL